MIASASAHDNLGSYNSGEVPTRQTRPNASVIQPDRDGSITVPGQTPLFTGSSQTTLKYEGPTIMGAQYRIETCGREICRTVSTLHSDTAARAETAEGRPSTCSTSTAAVRIATILDRAFPLLICTIKQSEKAKLAPPTTTRTTGKPLTIRLLLRHRNACPPSTRLTLPGTKSLNRREALLFMRNPSTRTSTASRTRKSP